MNLPPRFQTIVDHFITACKNDERIVAAFLGGSYARDAADEYSDLDLYLITTDQDFESFSSERDAFMQLLGEPVFIEDFDHPNVVFYIFADGTEGELGFERESQFQHIHSGPYIVLLDKKDILAGIALAGHEPDPVEQIEKCRRLIYWFWHDLSHFITALGRGQLWWAQGQLEELRRYCINLARLRNNFRDMDVGNEPYFKIEQSMPVEQLITLQETFCPMEKSALLKAALVILQFYKELAVPLAHAHEITYSDVLERIMVTRLESLRRQV